MTSLNKNRSLNLFAVCTVGGGFLVAVLMNFLVPENAVKLDYMIGNFLGAAAAGLVCGLIPFFAGRNRDRILAEKGLYASIGIAFVLGVIGALPMAIGFTVAVSRKPKGSAL
jgi:hypothetical protein